MEVLSLFFLPLKKPEVMEINWKIIAIVAIAAIGLVVYLIRQNQKDQDKVVKYFNQDTSELTEEEEELNNER
jgi:uncharacterized protein YoxC